MNKIYILFLGFILSGCSSTAVFTKVQHTEAKTCTQHGEYTSDLKIACDHFNMTLSIKSSSVEKGNSYIPFMSNKNEDWKVMVAIDLHAAEDSSLSIVSANLTISEPERLLEPILLKNKTAVTVDYIEGNSEGYLREIYLIRLKGYKEFKLEGLELLFQDHKYEFDEITISPDSTCYFESCESADLSVKVVEGVLI